MDIDLDLPTIPGHSQAESLADWREHSVRSVCVSGQGPDHPAELGLTTCFTLPEELLWSPL
jgi:hypothetical protein